MGLRAAASAIQPKVIANNATIAHCSVDTTPNDTTAIISSVAYTVRARAPPNVTSRARMVRNEGHFRRRVGT